MVEFYKHYFEDLARRQMSIRHTDEQEAFFYIKDKYNPKAFDDALKSAAKSTVFLLERYTYGLGDNDNKNYFSHINGRFTVVLLTELGNQDSIVLAEKEAERIILSILLKMNHDLGQMGTIELPTGEKQKVQFKFKNLPVDPVGPMLQKYHGATVGFTWNCPLPGVVKPEDWTNI